MRRSLFSCLEEEIAQRENICEVSICSPQDGQQQASSEIAAHVLVCDQGSHSTRLLGQSPWRHLGGVPEALRPVTMEMDVLNIL